MRLFINNNRIAGILLLLVWGYALFAPMLRGVNSTPDAIEYAGIARRWSAGKGFTTALKWHFLDEGPVVRPAYSERSPLYPLFAGGILRVFPRADSLHALQSVNALLAGFNILLALAAYRSVVSTLAAWIAAFLLPLLPSFTETATVALSEQLFLLFWLAALLMLQRPPSRRHALLFGLLAGSAALVRPNGLLLGIAALLPWQCGRKRLGAFHYSLVMLVGMMLVLLPQLLLSATAARHGVRPAFAVNYSVLHIHDASWYGFGRKIPSPIEFVRANPGTVAAAIWRKCNVNVKALWLTLGPLLLLLPVLLCRSGQPAWVKNKHARFWVLLGAANYLFYSLSWVASGAIRYQLPTTVLLLPLLVEIGAHAARRWLHARVLVVVVLGLVLASMASFWNRYRLMNEVNYQQEKGDRYHIAAEWLRAVAGREDVVACNNPWRIYYLTENPSVTCPVFRPGADVRALQRRFNVRWIVLCCGRRDPRLRYCLQAPGARLVRQGSDAQGLRVYLFALAGKGGTVAHTLHTSF